MALTWLIILVLVFHHSAPALSAVVSQRNLLQFNNMISYKGYSYWDYNGYGCWCGWGRYGSLTVDATDTCCQIHDQCYIRISGGLFGCSPKFVTYAWEEGSNNATECTDPIDTCDQNTCECDKAAADCFAQHRSTYRADFLNLGSSAELSIICNP